MTPYESLEKAGKLGAEYVEIFFNSHTELEPEYLENILNDKVNIIYGHNMKNGTMFKDVDKYNDKDFFDSHENITIYLEERKIDLKPEFCCYGNADEKLRKIEDINTLNEFCKDKTISNGTTPETFNNLYVLVTCNYYGNDYRTYLICTERVSD